MAFTREELLKIHDAPRERFKEVIQTLLEKLNNKEALTLAESKFICLGLKTIYKEGENGDVIAFKAEDFDQCLDFLFWSKYLIYWDNLLKTNEYFLRRNGPKLARVCSGRHVG